MGSVWRSSLYLNCLREWNSVLLAAFPQILIGVLLGCTFTPLCAQCHVPNESSRLANRTLPGQENSSTVQGERLLPEAGLLNDKTYTSLYFGFSFDLPIPLQGHRIMLPIRLPGDHALLGIGFQDGKRYGTLVVTAGGHREEDSRNMTPEQEQERIDEINKSKPGASPLNGLEYTPAPIHLQRVDKHAGDVKGTQFSARIREYQVHFTIQTNDKSFLEKSRQSIEAVRVFCTNDAGTFFTPEGKAFTPAGTFTDGPTIPTAIVDEAIRTHPAEETIPAGNYMANGEFRMPQLDLSYALPTDWKIIGQPAGGDPGETALEERLQSLWQSCARALFRANAPAGNGTYLELRALDQSCLGLPAPASATDRLGSESLGEYLQMLGHFGKIKANRLIQSGGRLFSVYQGTLAAGPAAHDLEQRAAEVIVATRYRKLIFAWCWRAPTESELRNIPPSRVSFGGGPQIVIGPGMAGVN